MPESMFISVVLPLPFSPSKRQDLALVQLQVHGVVGNVTFPNRFVIFSILTAHSDPKAVTLSLWEECRSSRFLISTTCISTIPERRK